MQDPTNERKRIYRVFHSIEDVKASVEETGHCLKGKALVSDNKAIRDGLGAVITKKQALNAHDPLQMQLAIEDGSPEGEPPKKRRRTTTPKQKSPEEQRNEELRKQLDQTIKSNLIQQHSVYFQIQRPHVQILRDIQCYKQSSLSLIQHDGRSTPRIQALSGKARTAAIKLVSKGIQHQEATILNLSI